MSRFARSILALVMLSLAFAQGAYAQTASCQVTYTKSWEGGNGFGASIDITNTGPAITNGWTLQFSFPNGQTMQNGWPVSFTQSGSQVTVASNADWNKAIGSGANPARPGGLLRWYGGLHKESNDTPSALEARGVRVLSATQFIAAGRPVIERLAAAAPDLDVTSLARALAAEARLTGAAADAVRGKVVFIGANASGTFEVNLIGRVVSL